MKRRGGRGLLTAMIDVKPEHLGEFTQWYETEHLPDRQKCPGFLTARRFVNASGAPREFLGIYDLANPEVRDTDAYKRIATTPWTSWIRTYFPRPSLRNFYREIGPDNPDVEEKDLTRTNTRGLVLVPAEVDVARHAGFEAWLSDKHFPEMDARKEFISVRAFKKVEGEAPDFLLVYEFVDVAVLRAPKFEDELGGNTSKPTDRYLYREIHPTL